jgi:hypothetical protein
MKLEKHLVLNKYFLNLFGFKEFKELREKLKNTQEGFDSYGRSFFIDALVGLKPDWEYALLRYDESIKDYIEKLKQNRKNLNFTLKYFQYLAVLFTEIFFDHLFNDKDRILKDLNELLEKFIDENKTEISPFKEKDLKKLAFWMATGSGKTLLMHINYWQIMKHSKGKWDNIILITPNEGLSRQHYEELKLSGIPSKLYEGNPDNIKTRSGEILIIDIHKLTEEKKGEGKSIDISCFDGKNLVFIDEGHKGQKSEEQKWKKLREEIGKNGFIFEYSATFGQVIGQNKDLLEEYAKAIIFDYSYKYFYEDNYGKDFYIYNIQANKNGNKEEYTQEQQNLLLTAGLLSFYEQLAIFENHKDEIREYNIEKPLWVFVGSKVTGQGVNSDVVKIIHFLNVILKDKKYLEANITRLLKGTSGLIDNKGNDIFEGKFEFIRNNINLNGFEAIIDDIYQKVFGGRGTLELYEIKNAEGEIGLKSSSSEKFFGVINVGDVSTLKKLITESGIEIKQDHFAQSLFYQIDNNNSNINILIGSKKFIEGWNSWRVSNMGLINMGKGEGPQIIQLFGRGVRLKGKDFSLKREENPNFKIKTLQTLYIFGLNADYMNAFLETIQKEEIEKEEEIPIPIKFNNTEKWNGKIYTIKTKDDFDFLKIPVKLTSNEKILKNIKIDLRPKITVAHGLKVSTAEMTQEPIDIPAEYFGLIDWNKIYSEVIHYKITKGMYNLIINMDDIKNLVKSKEYKIFLPETEGIKIESNGKLTLKITSFKGIEKLQEIILIFIRDYIEKFYQMEEKRKTMDYLEAEPLTIDDHSYMYPEKKEIILKIPIKLKDEIQEVRRQLAEYNPKDDKLPNEWKNWKSFIIHLDNHLYTPLIIWQRGKEDIKSIPVKLNKGETKFVKDLKDYIQKHIDKFEKNDIFLLRNLSRKGIGFFITSGFYPDFIIWLKKGNEQHMIFLDPKGIRNIDNFDDDKIKFCSSDIEKSNISTNTSSGITSDIEKSYNIKEIEAKIQQDLKTKGENIILYLDAFIISVSEYDEIKSRFGDRTKDEFESHKILFQEDPNYIKKIFKKISGNPK